MFVRLVLSPGAGALLSTIALASVSLLASGADGRVRLESSVLEQSRGHNLFWTLSRESCELQNGAEPCPPNSLGRPCAICETKEYVSVQFQGSGYGGYTTVPVPEDEDCGRFLMGACDDNQNCVDTTFDGGPCVKPYKVDVQEFRPPGDGIARGN